MYPIPEHPAWSILDPSKINDDFFRCERKFFYRHVLGWTSDAPNNHLVFGEAWHRALAFLYNNGFSAEACDHAFHEEFLKYYRSEFPEGTDELFTPKTPDNAFKMLALYTGKYMDDLEGIDVLYVEVIVSVPISPTRLIHGRMDLIYRRHKDTLYACDDHKTKQGYINHQYQNQWTGSFQMNTYTHALYCLFPIELVKGLRVNVACFPKTKTFNPDINRDLVRIPCWRSPTYMQNWLWLANDVFDRVEFEFERFKASKDTDDVLMAFPQRPTACSDFFGCPYLDFCFAWRNPLRKCEQPPSGFKVEFWNPLERPAEGKVDLEWPGGEQ